MLNSRSQDMFDNGVPRDRQESRRLSDVGSDLIATLRRRIWLLLGIALPLFAMEVLVISILPARYDATVRIKIDPSLNPMAQDQSQSLLNSEAIETEIGVMTSLELARKVVTDLHLDQDPEFTRKLPERGAVTPSEWHNMVARRVMANLGVGRDKLSYIVALSYRSPEAEKAADIANAFADSYVNMRMGSRVGTSERQAAFFKDRLGELGRDASAAEGALATYRARTGISNSATGSTVADQQIASLSSQLATAEAQAASDRSKANVAASQVAKGGLDALSEVRNSNVVSDLRRQRAEIVRNMGEVQSRYGERHPESIRVRDQLAAVDKQILQEAQRVVDALQADAAASAAQVASLRGNMNGLEGERARNTRASAEAIALERDAQSKRAAYDRMSQLSLDSTQSARGSIAQAEIIDSARAASGSASPNRKLLAVLAAVIALSVALGAVVILELFQPGLRTVAEVEDEFGLPVLASIPRTTRRRRGGKKSAANPANLLASDRATMFSEAFRNMRASIIGTTHRDAPVVIAFTSALPDEGKTTIALSFARMLAINASRTLLIDCDLRNGGLRDIIGHKSGGPDLIVVLKGETTLADAVEADTVAGLDILSLNDAVFTSQDLFDGDAMQRLLTQAKQNYDHVVLDLPPVLGVADARTLATIADATPFIVRWGKTSPKAVRLALSALAADNANVPGLIMSMVDPASDSIGGFYYSRKYAQYYQSS